MTRPVGAWTGCRARRCVGSSVSRLPGLAVAVVLLGALWPAMASAHINRREHPDRRAVRISLHTTTSAARVNVADLHLGTGETTPHGLAAVRRLQRGLRRAGYAPGPVDGRYGPLTAAAVERFQANHGLRVDGVVGPVTRRALRAAPVLALGAGESAAHGSPAVARLQRGLRRAGYAPGPVDGRFGPRTEDALLAFQRARRLTLDGVAGPVTERVLGAVQSSSHRPAGLTGAHRPHNPSPAPVSRVVHPQPGRSSRVAQTAPMTPHLPTLWILLGLAVLGLAAASAGYFQRDLVTGVTRLRAAVGQMRTRQLRPRSMPAPEPLPEPPGVKFVLYEDNGGGFYWTIVAEGGGEVARSARFTSFEEANDAADLVYRGAGAASFENRSEASPPAASQEPAPVDLAVATDVAAGPPRAHTDRPGSADSRTRGEGLARHWARFSGAAWPSGISITPGGRRR